MAIRALAAIGLLLMSLDMAQAARESGPALARKAAASLMRGNVKDAVTQYTSALKDKSLPNDRRANILNDRAVALSRLGNHRDAIRDFNRAIKFYAENPVAYNNRGNVLLAMGLLGEAIKDFNRAILLAPGYAAAHNNRAGAYARKGDMRAAVKDYNKAISLAPESSAPLSGRGRAHLVQDRPHAAMRDFTRAIKADSRFGLGYRSRAEALMNVERYSAAAEDLTKAIAFDRGNVELYLLRGHAYLGAKKPDKAVDDFTQAVELSPNLARGFEARGLAQAMAGNHDEALADLQRCLELDPRSALAYAYRGWVYNEMSQPELGRKDVDIALKLDPKKAEVHWARGVVLEGLGQEKEAVAALKKAVALKPTLKRAADALERLGVETTVEDVVFPDLGLDEWRVVARGKHYYAIHDNYPRLRVPLEVMSDVQPRLLDWDRKKRPYKDIGVLRFHAGSIDAPGGPQEVEYAAIVDLRKNKVIAVELHRQGEKVANWNWHAGRVTVASADGLTEEFILRKPRQIRRTSRRSRSRSRSRSRRSRRYRSRQRQRSRSLFDMIFNN